MARPSKKAIEEQKSLAKEEENNTAATTPPIKRKRRSKMAVGANAAFDIFSNNNDIALTRDFLAKAKLADGFKSAAEISRDYLPLPWPAMQYLIGRIGFPVNTLIEFIGQENTGKSSMVMSILANFVRYNIPCLYCNSEPKMLESTWIERLAGENVADGHKIMRVLEVSERLCTLDDMDKLIRKWVAWKRYEQPNPVPKSVPLVCVVDTISKLLNPEEAEVLLSQGKDKSTDVLKNNLDDVSKKPGVTAKWLHAWTRAITPLLNKENVTIICVSGQNQNQNAGSSVFAQDGGASLNKTRIGGTAMNQSTCIQITITKVGLWKDSKGDQIGDMIRARVVKNSYGPKRSITYGMRNDKFSDSDGCKQQALDMDETFANILVDNSIFGLTCTRKLYSSAELGLTQVRANVLVSKIMSDDDLMDKVGTALKIGGYEFVDEGDILIDEEDDNTETV